MSRATPGELEPLDVVKTAQSIQLLLDEIDQGHVVTTPEERHRLEGALTALAEVINR